LTLPVKIRIYSPLILLGLALSGCADRSTRTEPGAAAPSAANAPAPKPSGATKANDANGAAILARATVQAASRPPAPGSVPYQDAIIALRLTDVQPIHGKLPKGDLVAFVWGMKDNRPTKESHLTKGQSVTLSLIPWEKAEDEYGGYNRIELDDPDALNLETYWGEAK
jgi:hypothetical protein